MALKLKYAILSSVFFVFGTVSCTKDKEKVIYQPLTTNYTLGVTDSQQRMQKFEQIKSMELGGSLHIDLFKERGFNKKPLVIRVQSRCLSDSLQGEILQDQHFQNLSVIPIINLIATDALISTSSNPLRCHFEVTLKEQTSTANIYTLSDVIISNSATFSNTSFFPQTDNPSVQIFETLKLSPLPQMDSAYLRCRDFSKIAEKSQEDITWEEFLGETATEQTNWFSSSQSCRFYGKQGENVLLSQPFQLLFNPQPLILQPTFHHLSNADAPLTSRKVLTLHLTNPNSYRVRLRVEQPQENQFLFQPVYSHRTVGRAQIGNIHTFPMDFRLEDTPYLEFSTKEEWLVVIPPFQSIEIVGLALMDIDCRHNNFPPVGYFVGLYYGFNFKMSLSLDLGEDQWSPISLFQQELTKLQTFNPGFWDTHYIALKQKLGIKLPHSARSEEDFISSLYLQQGMDFCQKK